MTPFKLSIVSAISVLLPIVNCNLEEAFDWRKYFLLVLYLFIGGLNDLAGYVLILSKGLILSMSNLFQLLEFIMIVIFYKGLSSEKTNRYHKIILVVGIMAWVLDNLILHNPSDFNSLFRLIGPMLLILVCVDQINNVLLNRHISIIASEMFITAGFVLYLLYKAFIESFHLFPIHIQCPFYVKLWFIQCFINILLNVLISIAFLCHRSKPTFTILSSPH
jgi:hypothetical protein